jgi:protein-tyrosine phosphatase
MPHARTTLADLHNHLVPGVDDGSRTLDDALEGMSRLEKAGFTRIATTPHLEGSLTRRPEALEAHLETVDRAWESLRAALAEACPEMELLRGHEVMLDVPDPDVSDPRIRLAGTPYLLVEWPRLRVPPGTPRVLENLREAGYRPIVAHPERYHGMDSGSALPGEWKESGALLQVNFGSLMGRYGEGPRDRALTLLERGWVDLFSTDFHGRPHLDLYVEEVWELLAGAGGEEHFRFLAGVNPHRVLSGEDPVALAPLPVARSPWSRVKALFQKREEG